MLINDMEHIISTKLESDLFNWLTKIHEQIKLAQDYIYEHDLEDETHVGKILDLLGG